MSIEDPDDLRQELARLHKDLKRQQYREQQTRRALAHIINALGHFIKFSADQASIQSLRGREPEAIRLHLEAMDIAATAVKNDMAIASAIVWETNGDDT